MEVIKSLLMSEPHQGGGQAAHAVAAAAHIGKLGYEEYLMMLEVSLSLAVFLGTLTYGIRAYFRRRGAESKKIKEECQDLAKSDTEDTIVEEDDAETEDADSDDGELEVMLLTISGDDMSEDGGMDIRELLEQDANDDMEETDVRKIVDAIEKISELEPLQHCEKQLVGHAVWEPEPEQDQTEEEQHASDEEAASKEETEEDAEKNKNGFQEEIMQVRRQASLTMRKPFVVYYNPHRPAPPMDKRGTMKRSTSQGGHNQTPAPAARNPRANARVRSKDRSGSENDAADFPQ